MADMTVFSEKVTRRAWLTEPQLDGPLSNFTIPAAAISYFDGQALGRDASGTIVQMDDTLKAEFVGFETDVIAASLTVNPTDTIGDKRAHIHRPYAFVALIAAAAAGDEGKRVFWKFNNEVSYSTAQCNLAGTVLGVLDTTHVLVLCPWLRGYTQGGDTGVYTTAAAAGTTLTKWDANKVILMPLTSSEAITLPAAAALSPGDKITFINTSANTSTPTLTAAGADTINGAATYAQSTTQYAVAVLRSDGVSAWYVEVPGPSGTVGATTFTGNVAVSSATLVVTDTVAKTLAVGPNGGTNPALSVDCSVGSAITGINIVGRASGSGVTLATLGGTDEDLLVAPKGAGGVKVTSTSANALAVGRLGSTTPALQVNAATATCITGLLVTAAAAGNGLAIKAQGETNVAVTLDSNGSGTLTLQGTATGNVLCGQGLLSSSATKGVGYATGAGGTVTQLTGRTTSVILNNVSGNIVLFSAAGSATPFSFTLTNSAIAAGDTVILNQKSGTDKYTTQVVTAVAAGSCVITLANASGTTTEQPVFNFNVIKGVAA